MSTAENVHKCSAFFANSFRTSKSTAMYLEGVSMSNSAVTFFNNLPRAFGFVPAKMQLVGNRHNCKKIYKKI